MELTKEDLDKIREALPQGAQAEIAEEASYSPDYISQVLTGNKPITDKNKSIISIAMRKIREKNEEEEKIMAEVKNLKP